MPEPSSEPRLVGRYDAGEVRRRLEAEGVLDALVEKGFGAFDVTIDATTHALPCVLVFARRGAERHLLLEAVIGESSLDADFFARRGYAVDRPMVFVLVYWLREQDPTRRSSAERPLLPLQLHPGLGVLRRAFRVVTSMAADLGKDGVASVPKFFHDAVLFYRSRLFLFADGREQGRFEALMRDLARLPLGDASLALACGEVRTAAGDPAVWSMGYQVFPLSERARAYFHSPVYEAEVRAGIEQSSFTCDAHQRRRDRGARLLGLPTLGERRAV